MSIKSIRKELGLSQSGFASLFGVHQTAVSQWETGRTNPDIDTIIRIARATQRSVDEVLDVHTPQVFSAGKQGFTFAMPDDSMASLRIRRSDMVCLTEEDKEVRDGMLAGIQREDGITARYIKRIGEKWFLLSAETPPEITALEEGDRILGRVQAFYSRIDEEPG